MNLNAKAWNQLARDMRKFEEVRPHWGCLKIAFAVSFLTATSYMGLSADRWSLIVSWGVVGGLAYAYALIPTHDAIHYTLTGWKWVDELYSRLVAYPIIWTHGTYAHVHRIHHRMNGLDVADPERKNPTEAEYFHQNPIKRFYYRHRLMVDVFVFAGLGLIITNLRDGFRYGKKSASARRAVFGDLLGILLTHAMIIAALLPLGLVSQFYLLVIIWERVAGGILQFRAHIEHDSIDLAVGHHYLLQITSCRNIRTHHLISRYFNRLTYHSVHHTFPNVPFYSLPAAHAVMVQFASQHGIVMTEDHGYWGASVNILREPRYFLTDHNGRIVGSKAAS